MNVEANIQTKMAEFAYRPGNYMDRVTILRRIAPERWNPEYKVTTTVDHNYKAGLVDKLNAIDAEITGSALEVDTNPTGKLVSGGSSTETM